MKYYDIGSIIEFLSKIKGSIRIVLINLRGVKVNEKDNGKYLLCYL